MSTTNKVPLFTVDSALGTQACVAATITQAGQDLIAGADAAAQRTTLGLGTLATQSGTFSGTASGTNTGDQTITLTGDVTGTGTGSFAATIANAAVTLAKQANMATASVVYRKTAGSGAPEVQTLATLKTDLSLTGTNSGDQTITLTGDVTGTGTGSFATAIKASVSLTTPVIGVATGTSLAVTGAITSSGTAGIGYASGAGGTVTQLTSKSTGVTLNKLCGTITMNGAALAAAAIVTFTVTNNTVAATDVVHVQHDTVGTISGYTVMPNTSASGSFKISVRNNTAGSLSEAIVLRFAVVKAVAA